MSRTLETKSVERLVYVYSCDRCGKEMAPTQQFGLSHPGEGAQITAREYQEHGHPEWLPLAPSDDDNWSRHHAANADLCPSCTASLLLWFGGVEGTESA